MPFLTHRTSRVEHCSLGSSFQGHHQISLRNPVWHIRSVLQLHRKCSEEKRESFLPSSSGSKGRKWGRIANVWHTRRIRRRLLSDIFQDEVWRKVPWYITTFGFFSAKNWTSFVLCPWRSIKAKVGVIPTPILFQICLFQHIFSGLYFCIGGSVLLRQMPICFIYLKPLFIG